jgi:putative transposase
MNTRVKAETKGNLTRIKALQRENEHLKKLMRKKNLDLMVEISYLEGAAQKPGHKSVLQLKKN